MLISWPLLALACTAVALAAWAATWAVLRGLVRFQIYNRPTLRSSHARPKPRGGGRALIPVILFAWIAARSWLGAAPPGFWLMLSRAAGLAVVSWIDDLKGLPAGLRLAV